MKTSKDALEKAITEAKAALRRPSDAHLIERDGSYWHPAVLISKMTLRRLLRQLDERLRKGGL